MIPIAAILFDFDGLVLDTETSEFETVAILFEEHGLVLPRDEWIAFIGTADHPHWTDLLATALGRPLDDLDAVIERRRALHHARIRRELIRPGVVELATEARNAGLGVAIASSSPREWVQGHLERHGIAHLFPVTSTRTDVGVTRTKPQPDLFLLAAERLGVDPTACVVLEDSEPGIAAAIAAGALAVAVPGGMTADAPFVDAHHVVRSVAEVDVDVLSGWMTARGTDASRS